MQFSESYQRRLHIWQSNFGRDEGWYVELEGVTIAELVDCRFEDMFWDSYRIVPIDNELGIDEELSQRPFWNRFEKLAFRNRRFEELADAPWPATTPLDEEGRLHMRGLYLNIGNPSWLDEWVLWWISPKKP